VSGRASIIFGVVVFERHAMSHFCNVCPEERGSDAMMGRVSRASEHHQRDDETTGAMIALNV